MVKTILESDILTYEKPANGGYDGYDIAYSVDMEKLEKEFSKQYKRIYDCEDNLNGYDDAINTFDEKMKNDKEFNEMVNDFVSYHEDFISSDREAAAFMFALVDLGVIDNPNKWWTIKYWDNNVHKEGYRRTAKRESVETISPAEIYDIAVKELPKEDIDHHESDLYIRVTPESKRLISRLQPKSLLSTFIDNIDHDEWYELPFCYGDYFTKKSEGHRKVNKGKPVNESTDYLGVGWEELYDYELGLPYYGYSCLNSKGYLRYYYIIYINEDDNFNNGRTYNCEIQDKDGDCLSAKGKFSSLRDAKTWLKDEAKRKGLPCDI